MSSDVQVQCSGQGWRWDSRVPFGSAVYCPGTGKKRIANSGRPPPYPQNPPKPPAEQPGNPANKLGAWCRSSPGGGTNFQNPNFEISSILALLACLRRFGTLKKGHPRKNRHVSRLFEHVFPIFAPPALRSRVPTPHAELQFLGSWGGQQEGQKQNKRSHMLDDPEGSADIVKQSYKKSREILSRRDERDCT